MAGKNHPPTFGQKSDRPVRQRQRCPTPFKPGTRPPSISQNRNGPNHLRFCASHQRHHGVARKIVCIPCAFQPAIQQNNIDSPITDAIPLGCGRFVHTGDCLNWYSHHPRILPHGTACDHCRIVIPHQHGYYPLCGLSNLSCNVRKIPTNRFSCRGGPGPFSQFDIQFCQYTIT